MPDNTYKELGFWSSHPRALQKSRKVFLLLSLIPLFVFFAILILVCSDFETCKRLLTNPGLPLKIGAISLCLSLGAIFGVCLINFMSICFPTKDTKTDKDIRPFSPWIILLFALAWIVPWLVSLFKNSIWNGPYIGIVEFVLNFMCLAPFFWICILLLFCGRREKTQKNIKIPLLPLVCGIVALLIAALPFFTDIHGGIAALFPDSKIAQLLHQSIIRLVLFGLFFPIGTMLLCIWQALIKSQYAENADEQSVEDCLQGENKDVNRTVQIINDFIAKDEDISWSEALFRESREGAKSTDKNTDSANVDFKIEALFRGMKPTFCQEIFLRNFENLYEQYIKNKIEGETENIKPLDIIITGECGSGRTEALCVASILAVLTRGDKVLFLVKDEISARVAEKRIGNILKNMFLAEQTGEYISVKRLGKDCFTKWVNDNSISSAPDVLISTPATFEKEIFSSSFDATSRLCALDILLEYSTLLIDDVCDHSFSVQAHLVFLLKKLRMLLKANGRFSQLVMVVPELTENSSFLSILKEKFPFEKNQAEDISFVPNNNFAVWHGSLQIVPSTSILDACIKIADLCVSNGLKLVLLSSVPIDDAFRLRYQSKGVLIINRFAKWELCERGFDVPDVVICLSGSDAALTNAIRCNLMSESSILIYIPDEKSPKITTTPLVRILPDNTSRALCLTHIRSLLPFILPKLPISGKLWNMFGIRFDSDLMASESPSNFVNCVDLSCDVLSGNGYNLEPEISLLTNLMSATTVNEINYGTFPEATGLLWQTGDSPAEREIHIAEAEKQDGALLHYAQWKDSDNNPLTKSDLANGDSLVCVFEGVRYYCDTLIPNHSVDCAMTLKGVPCHDTDGDYTIPVRNISWTFPEDISIVEFRKDNDCRMARFRIPEQSETNVECILTGNMNKLGHEQNLSDDGDENINAKFGYKANFTGFILSPVSSVKSIVGGTWKTERAYGYSSCLTHALTAVFRTKFEGFNFYASLLAFAIPEKRESVGEVLIWIVEPENTGRVCSKTILEMFRKRESLTEEVLREALQIIKDPRNNGIDKLRILSGVAYSSETLEIEDVEASCNILEQVLSSTEERKKKDAENRKIIQEFLEKQNRIHKSNEEWDEKEVEFNKVVVEALINFEESIDITKFVVKYHWDDDKIIDLFSDVLWNNPQIFYVNAKRFSFASSINPDGEIISCQIIKYKFSIKKEDYSSRKAELDAAVAKVMKLLVGVDDLAVKAQILHDYIVRYCEYDEKAAAEDDSSPLARTVYSVLVRRKAVCEGYTMAYRYLLNKVGIRSEEVLSEEMNHCWNYVRIGDNWYHVDVTHDDPIFKGKDPETYPILHDCFLKSDEAIKANGHKGWDVRDLPAATDTSFDNRKWKVIESLQ